MISGIMNWEVCGRMQPNMRYCFEIYLEELKKITKNLRRYLVSEPRFDPYTFELKTEVLPSRPEMAKQIDRELPVDNGCLRTINSSSLPSIFLPSPSLR
jgi:hypothetical protein